MKAIILAAGKGSRLQPLTDHTPKPLIQVAGKPILDRIIENLPDAVDEVVLITKHLSDQIESHVAKQTAFGVYRPKVTIVPQGPATGTYGALLSIKDLIAPGERFFVMNGDDLVDKAELEQHLQFPLSSGIQKKVWPAYYSSDPDADGIVRQYRTQTPEEKINGTHVSNGVFVLDDRIFSFPAVEIAQGELGLPQTIIAQTETYPLHAVITTKWHSINDHDDLEAAHKRFL
ncbi:MAG: D-glycero-alpha-D-manno-heptose 1-phosphate guanylyltransferase [Candidatus Parcubacteria bacterium]|jgi:NDP-sugar pyrophosphorylase family protein